ncbi:MAG: hypothetical protein M1833_005211 [Piccolia ochrophora]|nr:MAG: hypothetical protein M1833_005211 [Piccolia ochrophora]
MPTQAPRLRRPRQQSIRPVSADLTDDLRSPSLVINGATPASLPKDVSRIHRTHSFHNEREFPLFDGGSGAQTSNAPSVPLRPRTRTLEERSRNRISRTKSTQPSSRQATAPATSESTFKEPTLLQRQVMAALAERERSTVGEGNRMAQVSAGYIHARKEGPSAKDHAIVKVGKLLLWDRRALATSDVAAIKTKRLQKRRGASPQTGPWQLVSCVLRDNGELKLFNETDVTLVSVLQLSELPRSAVRRLDRTVLSKDCCIAISPHFLRTHGKPSFEHNIYISLDSRVLFEVWFVLLRAFTVPEFFGPESSDSSDEEIGALQSSSDSVESSVSDLFRVVSSLHLRIIEAKLRPPRPRTTPESKVDGEDHTVGSYFVEVVLEDEVRARTIIRHDTNSPFWREEFEFPDLPEGLSGASVNLEREDIQTSYEDPTTSKIVSDGQRSRQTRSTHCGRVDIRLHEDAYSQLDEPERWLALVDGHSDVIGDVLLKFRSEKVVVLTSSNYEQLCTLLRDSAGRLTSDLAQSARPGLLQRLSEVLLDIYQAFGLVGEWLNQLVDCELQSSLRDSPLMKFRQTTSTEPSSESSSPAMDREQILRDLNKLAVSEANLLFRGNSLLTKALELHIKRVGKEYLENTLGERLREIDERDVNCEVDPMRLTFPGDVDRNWQHLVKLFRGVWNSIRDSAEQCPQEMRLLFAHVRKRSEAHFREILRTVSYSSVSSFLFLRFFCPAILNPKLFGLIKHHPNPKTQRTLTLIAKSLQGLANMSTFGGKEPWMEPMNRYLTVHRQEFRDFLDSICMLPSISSTRSKSPAPLSPSYATPTTILSRLPPASREALPSLPYLLDPTTKYATLVNIWLDNCTQRRDPNRNNAQLDDPSSPLYAFHAECVRLRRRTCDLLAAAERAADRASNKRLSLRFENLRRQLDHAVLADPFEAQTPLSLSTNGDFSPAAGGGGGAWSAESSPRAGRWGKASRLVDERAAESDGDGGGGGGRAGKQQSALVGEVPERIPSPAVGRMITQFVTGFRKRGK